MFCKNCGAQIETGYGFCKQCGTPVENTDGVINNQGKKPNESNGGVSKTRFTKRVVYAVLAVLIILLCIGIICLFKQFKPFEQQPIDGVWVYNEASDENIGTFCIRGMYPLDSQTFIYLHSDGSIQYETAYRTGNLDSYSLVDDSFVWILPLGTKYFYGYELSKNKLQLKDEEGNVAVFEYFDSLEKAKEYLNSKSEETVFDTDYDEAASEEEEPQKILNIEPATEYISEVVSPAPVQEYISETDTLTSVEENNTTTEMKPPKAFYGIWIGYSPYEEEAHRKADEFRKQGIEAEVYLTTDWSNLNSNPYYVITAGSYEDLEDAEEIWKEILDEIPDSYIKFSGEYTKSDKGYNVKITVQSFNDIEINADSTTLFAYDIDNHVLKNYVIDEDTTFALDCDMQYFSNYKDGDSVLDWVYKNYSFAQFDETNLALLGVYDCDLTGNHIDTIHGLYWWD